VTKKAAKSGRHKACGSFHVGQVPYLSMSGNLCPKCKKELQFNSVTKFYTCHP